MTQRPNDNEFSPLFKTYIDLVPEGNILSILQTQRDEHVSLLSKLSEEHANFRYAPDKWSIKTVVGHISDVERLWSYRLLRIARNDVRELTLSDRDTFAEMSACDSLPLVNVLNDYSAVRHATLSLIENLPKGAITRVGEYNNHTISARAIIYILLGHDIHHINVIKSRYLNI